MRGGPLGKHAVGELLWLLPVSSVRSMRTISLASGRRRRRRRRESAKTKG